MREIKFRTWSIIGRRMYDWEQMHAYPAHHLSQYFRHHDMYALMQYTGLKDKNGVGIYEGDIVHIASSPQEDNKVEYCKGIYMLLPHGLYLSDWYQSVEVIGNIYENPELVGRKENENS